MPNVIIEVRMDGAFFSDDILNALEEKKVEYTISVPFERFAKLKKMIEKRCKWDSLNETHDYFETSWKPQSWDSRRRFIFVRQHVKEQYKKVVQLDLFIPYVYGYEFKVVITNKKLSAGKAVSFHNGRGSQEGLFAELKSQNQMAYIPSSTWNGNQVYLTSAILAHNLSRELQMITRAPTRKTEEKRPALWKFEQLGTLRRRIIQRAGRLIRPQGRLTLSMSANKAAQTELLHYLDKIEEAI